MGSSFSQPLLTQTVRSSKSHRRKKRQNHHVLEHQIFHAAAGYTRAEYDEYTRIGTVNVLRNKSGKLVKDYWGINQLGVSLLYDF